jgi:hypothetical protein
MFPLNTILAWSINIIMNKKYDNNNIIIASRAYFLQDEPFGGCTFHDLVAWTIKSETRPLWRPKGPCPSPQHN